MLLVTNCSFCMQVTRESTICSNQCMMNAVSPKGQVPSPSATGVNTLGQLTSDFNKLSADEPESPASDDYSSPPRSTSGRHMPSGPLPLIDSVPTPHLKCLWFCPTLQNHGFPGTPSTLTVAAAWLTISQFLDLAS